MHVHGRSLSLWSERMRTAILLGALLIAKAIDPDLEWATATTDFVGYIFLAFLCADLWDVFK